MDNASSGEDYDGSRRIADLVDWPLLDKVDECLFKGIFDYEIVSKKS
jgi:hypothetical protein